MNKRRLHHIWVKLKPVSYWYFLALTILSLGVFILSYRQTDLTMVRLRNEVFRADEQGENIEKPLYELREFVYSHMAADLTKGDNAIKPPIQLKHTYERLLAAERTKVDGSNKRINDEAIALCEQRFPAGQLQSGRVECIRNHVLAASGPQEQPIPKELYQFDFVSPIWSPDLTGWSLLASAVFFMLFILRFSLERWLKHQLD